MKQKPKELEKKAVGHYTIQNQPNIMNIISLEKPKELDWKEKFKNEFYEGDDYTSNKYENLVSFIEYEILPQQRTELLEEMANNFYGGGWDKLEASYYNDSKEKFIENFINLLNKKDD